MSKAKNNNEILYQSTMSIARNMLKSNLISREEYNVIDTIFLEKYKPTLGSLFSNLA